MEALGIDYKLLIGQIINFLILLLILWRFAYKPVVKMLEDRRQKVAKSLEDAKNIEVKLVETEKNTQAMMDKARSEASLIIEETTKAANQEKKGIVDLAKSQAGQEIEKAKIAINEEKEAAKKELGKELTRLVSLATQKILKKETSSSLQQEAIDEAIGELKTND